MLHGNENSHVWLSDLVFSRVTDRHIIDIVAQGWTNCGPGGSYLIYLLTAIALTHGGSSTVYIYTQIIHRTTQSKQTIHRTTHLKHRTTRLTFRRRIKSRLPFAGIIRRLPYSTRFQDKG